MSAHTHMQNSFNKKFFCQYICWLQVNKSSMKKTDQTLNAVMWCCSDINIFISVGVLLFTSYTKSQYLTGRYVNKNCMFGNMTIIWLEHE